MRKAVLTILFLVWAVLGSFADGIAITHGPYLQNVGETEATFVWVANKPSIGWVELAPDDGTNYYAVERPKYFDTTNGVKNTSTLHSVKVKGLKPVKICSSLVRLESISPLNITMSFCL